MLRPVFAAGVAVLSAPSADAQVAPASGCEFSSNLALVSDYRGRGVTYSGGAAAIQGGIDLAGASGWSGGLWASSVDPDWEADLEVDIYAAKSFDIGSAELSLGATAYVFPGVEDWDFGEAQASVAFAAGPMDATLALNYAWEQDNLGDEDNLYVALNGATPIGRLGGIPITAGASIGYEEGPFAIEESKTDWSLSVTAEVSSFEFSVSYVDTDLGAEPGEAGVVFSIARTF
jgi:uncharacterized protein (TIGR02001 family)